MDRVHAGLKQCPWQQLTSQTNMNLEETNLPPKLIRALELPADSEEAKNLLTTMNRELMQFIEDSFVESEAQHELGIAPSPQWNETTKQEARAAVLKANDIAAQLALVDAPVLGLNQNVLAVMYGLSLACDVPKAVFFSQRDTEERFRLLVVLPYATKTDGGDGITYPTRCVIVDAEGMQVGPGMVAATPEASKPHIGKHGTANKTDDGTVIIALDGGGVLNGFECWWKPLKEG